VFACRYSLAGESIFCNTLIPNLSSESPNLKRDTASYLDSSYILATMPNMVPVSGGTCSSAFSTTNIGLDALLYTSTVFLN
jgi:hypothetical protein